MTTVEEGLRRAAQRLAELGDLPTVPIAGKLLRPRVAFAAAPGSRPTVDDEAFWLGALAIQMVHEASLLHDDILDDANRRRGQASLAAARGVGVALVEGDHLLTAAYRAAALTGSIEFMHWFTRAVERTVAGEKAQCSAQGRPLEDEEYRQIVAGKSGALFGAALALPECLAGRDAHDRYALGVRIGSLYQRVDDMLDFCREADLGKPPLQDLEQKKWTWPLAVAGHTTFPDEELAVTARRLFVAGQKGSASPMRRCLTRLERERDRILHDWQGEGGDDRDLAELLDGWLQRARTAVESEEAELTGAPDGAVMERVRAEATALGDRTAWTEYFAHHSKSFRFSARLFPDDAFQLVSGVYAYCRFTDDLVDRDPDRPAAERRDRLAAWAEWTRRAYRDPDTGIPLLDEVMGETAARGVSLDRVEELIRGVEMDLEPRTFADLSELRVYSYRVASVVGLWLTELFGTRTPWVLERAEAMGHAMQLTNILRDVGEDLERGRLYLPMDRLAAHGITPEALRAHREREEGLPEGWIALMEELMGVAERDYARAFEAIPELPDHFQKPVAVAGRVYRGIHREIRRNHYDNLRRRAYTSLPRKLVMGGFALRDLRRARGAATTLHPEPEPGLRSG